MRAHCDHALHPTNHPYDECDEEYCSENAAADVHNDLLSWFQSLLEHERWCLSGRYRTQPQSADPQGPSGFVRGLAIRASLPRLFPTGPKRPVKKQPARQG
jgi:hypothetical protein